MKVRTIGLCLLLAFSSAGLTSASHIVLTPGDMPSWDADLRFIGYGSDFGFGNGNDTAARVESMLAISAVNTGPEVGLTQIAKSDGAAAGFSYTGLGTTAGTWQYSGPFEIQYLTLKGGNNQNFALYELKTPYVLGTIRDWNTENLSAGMQNNVPTLSHMTFYSDGSLVPEPGAATALMALATVGLLWRRRGSKST